MTDALMLAAVAVVAALGSMVNSIAGGGTLLTFPALVAFGVPPLVANATSTVALSPGALTSMLGYRKRLRGLRHWSYVFAVPSVAGGLAGAWLLLSTPADRFSAIVPWLVFGATALFAVQGPIRTWMRRQAPASSVDDDAHFVPRHSVTALIVQFLVGVYGGYFGAGIGILMLAVLGFLGFSDIHRMNGLKNWGGFCINVVAAALFVVSGIVNWPVAAAMAAGAMAGGYLTAHLAQRVPQSAVRRAILVIGVVSGVWLLWAPL
ncbi:MAG: sulfite exporter TauE/SafE family protein [Vicinamibacterales bacterium]|nr:sulfite exporter TauE/SafE family protein [Vicinamibacterales bacterium]